MTEPRSQPARLVSAVVAHELAVESAHVLARAGVEVMPLKGVLLQRTVYAGDPSRRLVTDVDILVRASEFGAAVRALAQAGYQERLQLDRGIARVFQHPRWPLVVDLHRRLFPRGLFRLDADAVLSRGRPDTELFGAPVLVMDPYDLWAHLVGKAACDHIGPDARVRLAELALIARHFTLEPARCVERLEVSGLARAARYVLPMVREVDSDPFITAVVARFGRDVVGDVLVRAAREIVLRTGSLSTSSRVAGHILNVSLPAAAISGARGALARLRRRASGSTPRRTG